MSQENVIINDYKSTFISNNKSNWFDILEIDKFSENILGNNENNNLVILGKAQGQDISILTALKEICPLSLPTILFFLCLFAQQTINLIFIGQIFSKKEKQDVIDGIGISHLNINYTCFSIVVGLITDFETLGSNAFGAKKYYLLGIYFHRAQIISYIFISILIIILL